MPRVFIVDGLRTPIGRFGGGLIEHSAAELATTVVKALIERNSVAGEAVDRNLESKLSRLFPAGGAAYGVIESACHGAIEAGWMCAQGAEGRRFGRVIEPAPDTHDLSVDVVSLKNVVGPHHRHPNGEICLTMPLNDGSSRSTLESQTSVTHFR